MKTNEGTTFTIKTVNESLMMLSMIYCRCVPASEIIEIARYLDNLFSCNVDSLPTELLLHSYWTLMPKQFATVRAYGRCLKTRSFMGRSCEKVNPYYCGRRFGEQSAVDRLAVCRQLMSGGDPANYAVPELIRVKTKRYRACLSRSRGAVVLDCFCVGLMGGTSNRNRS